MDRGHAPSQLLRAVGGLTTAQVASAFLARESRGLPDGGQAAGGCGPPCSFSLDMHNTGSFCCHTCWTGPDCGPGKACGKGCSP
ncbi:hypothetical protein Franean1_4392 [Parafrankia sp. EAN1pec]|nr:hypothetical protein Franean1_4392 [Frankia sp. EAN1pec]